MTDLLSSREILADYIASLVSSGYDEIWDRFTREQKGLLTRRSRVVRADPELVEVYDFTGAVYQIGVWVAIEGECNLHVFVTVYPERRADLALSEDFIVGPTPC